MGPGIDLIDSISCGDYEAYFFRVFGRRVTAKVTRTASVVRRWIRGILYFNSFRYYRGELVVGLGVQWRSDPRKGGNEPVATVQFCVGPRCLIFQIIHAESIPRIMERFLSNPDVTFVNVGTDQDRRRLEEHCNLRVARAVDLWKRAPCGRISLEEMAARYLGWNMDDDEMKPMGVGRSDWEVEVLDDEQVRYACLDVYSSFLLELKFREMGYAPSY